MIYQTSDEEVCTLEDMGFNIQLKYLYFQNSDIHIPGSNNKNA